MRLGIDAGLALLVLPVLVVAAVRFARPADAAATQILGAETLLVVASQVAISICVACRTPTAGILQALIPACVAGVIVAAADIAGSSFVFDTSPAAEVVSALAYDVVLGALLTLPAVIVLHAASRSRAVASKSDVDASPNALISAYRRVLADTRCRGARWHLFAQLVSQLLRRHVRRTLEGAERGYATIAVERGLADSEARDRQAVHDYLLSVPPVSRVVPIPTVATVFVLWKVVPVIVAAAGMAAAWFGGGHWGLANLSQSIDKVVPHELASLVIDVLALVIAFALLMLLLAPAIHRRDTVLAEYGVCEREVVLMDDRLHVPRSSRRLEYVMASIPALPLALYGGAVLTYAIAGLFVYPSPKGPLGGLVQRADLLHLGPVTGAVLADALLVVAAVWIAWIIKTRRTTRVVFL